MFGDSLERDSFTQCHDTRGDFVTLGHYTRGDFVTLGHVTCGYSVMLGHAFLVILVTKKYSCTNKVTAP